MISVEQIKAARAMLGISQKELAGKSNVAVATINNIERGAQKDPKISTMRSLKQALEFEGIAFVDDPQKGVGVFMRKQVKYSSDNVVLIIDDSAEDRMLFKTWLEDSHLANVQVVEADDARSGMDRFVEHGPACVVLDFMMYGTDGFQLLASLKQDQVSLPPIVFVTASESYEVQSNAVAEGVFAYMNKQDADQEYFCNVVEQALRTRITKL